MTGRVEDLELDSATTPPLTALQPVRRSWRAFLSPRVRPSGAHRWSTARSALDGALSEDQWRELKELSNRDILHSDRGAPHAMRLETARGSDSDGVPWAELLVVDVSDTGVLRIRRVRRRFVDWLRVRVDVLHDTRAEGLPPTDFDVRELHALGSQRHVDDLDRYLADQGVVPRGALEEMFIPDRGRVPTGRDQSDPSGVSFSGSESGATWWATVGPTGHVRVHRSEPLTRTVP